MVHDPVHDWLDMAFSKAGGDKNAYKRYKKEKDRENKRINDMHTRNRAPDIRTDVLKISRHSRHMSEQPLGAWGSRAAPSTKTSKSSSGVQVPEQGFQCREAQIGRTHSSPLRGQYPKYSGSLSQLQQQPQIPDRPSSRLEVGSQSGASRRSERVSTERYPLGDMTRTYVEGMVPPKTGDL